VAAGGRTREFSAPQPILIPQAPPPRMKVVSSSLLARPVAPESPVVEPVATEAAPLFDVAHEPAIVAPVELRWSAQFDPRSGSLDEIARLRLIGDLGVIAADWCVPLLGQAYDEEPRADHRQAALTALAACHNRAAIPIFQRALASGDATQRSIAADALADLEPPPQVKRRRIVERH
jgi:hypothetical protein